MFIVKCVVIGKTTYFKDLADMDRNGKIAGKVAVVTSDRAKAFLFSAKNEAEAIANKMFNARTMTVMVEEV